MERKEAVNTPSVSLYNDHRNHPTYSAEEHRDEIQNVNGGNAVHREHIVNTMVTTGDSVCSPNQSTPHISRQKFRGNIHRAIQWTDSQRMER